MKNIIHSLFIPPKYNNDEKNRIAIFLHTIIITILIIAFLVGVTDAFVGVYATGLGIALGMVPLAFALLFARRDQLILATYITLTSLTITVTFMLAIGQGIHDIGILFYALILIITSFLLPRKGMLIVTAILIASTALIVWGEIYNFLPLQIKPQYFTARPADFLIVSLSLIIGAVAISIMSETMGKALKTARDSEAKWRSLVDNAPDLIIIIKPDGTTTFINNAAAHHPSNIKIGSIVYDFLPEDTRSRARLVINKVMAGGSEMRDIPINLSRDTTHWYSLRIGPIKEPDGQVTGAMIIATDIQHLKNIEFELNKSRDTLRNRAEQLTTLYDISKTLTTLRNLENTLKLILSQIIAIIPLDAFIVTFYDQGENEVSYPLVYDSGQVWSEKSEKLLPESWVAHGLIRRKAFIIHRNANDLDYLKSTLPLGDKLKPSASIMIAPLLAGENIIGLISTHSYTFNAYTQEFLTLLDGAANQIAIAVENSRLYDELQKELAERKRAEAEIREFNIELENHVRQRTIELEEANHELASFTYTVSHDLRAPIRGIHGLSHIFLDEFGKGLSDTGVQYIHRIQSNALQMGQLIDDLLTFTHIGRQVMYYRDIDLAEMAQSIFDHLEKGKNDNLRLVIRSGPVVYGDYALLFQAISNLLSNAIKFTSFRNESIIEFGGEKVDNELRFYIKDNGAGFDMNYSSKLFGVFQRLHRQDEFEGTGVGLAIVKRIIQRHAGNVWAEGKPGQGATFYFTLPEKER